ncbi:hypothetical protein ACVWYQ_006362 [Bradyrhizobium sp. USDA 3397]
MIAGTDEMIELAAREVPYGSKAGVAAIFVFGPLAPREPTLGR